jgi:hypothetical protein
MEMFAMDMPRKALVSVDRNGEYVALLTYLPLRKYRAIPSFFLCTFQIQRQLNETPGAIGYSLRAKPLSRNFWTLSVWENERALMDFVAKVPHVDAMKAFSPHMGATKFTRWKVAGSSIPLNWDDAVRHASQES